MYLEKTFRQQEHKFTVFVYKLFIKYSILQNDAFFEVIGTV